MRLLKQYFHSANFRRLATLSLALVFACAGSPVWAIAGMGAVEQNEQDTKPPVVEESTRAQIVLAESSRLRLKYEISSTFAARRQHVGIQCDDRSLVDLIRRGLDKQNGLGVFLRV